MYIIDVFSGCGGFTQGAKQAGATVILAVDSWKDALDVHALNHPETEHWHEVVGGDPSLFAGRLRAVADLKVPAGEHLHVHFSPPCQQLSGVNHSRNELKGLALVEWAFQVAELLCPDSFTVEQVRNPLLLRTYAHLPHRIYKMCEHGIPQTRVRVLFGDAPALPLAPAEPILSFLNDVNILPGMCITNHNMKRVLGKKSKPIAYATRDLSQTSFTVTRAQPQLYRNMKATILPIEVVARLQTFDPNYFAGLKMCVARRLIGNAVPPSFAELVVRELKKSLQHELPFTVCPQEAGGRGQCGTHDG
ncbi:S-adenosyl-L-methionine-dependent methyltransferase [Tribonema minus]|uniref:DNA (cytosine-5-)-methyltransferase n=1 Tax=Tribonema minus TaxID=303371 RepID=A0A835Z4U7_9STRA|nr:S-adenosyl-L-methionine-dependent methyltransferase [Tribonema minus]